MNMKAVIWLVYFIFVMFAGLTIYLYRRSSLIGLQDRLAQGNINQISKAMWQQQEQQKSYLERLKLELERSRTGITVNNYLIMCVLFCVAIFIGVNLIMDSVVIALPMSFLGVIFPKQIVKSRSNKIMKNFNYQLIKALRRISSVLHSGGNITQAVQEVAVGFGMSNIVREEFQKILTDIKYNTPLPQALYSCYERTGSKDMLLFAISVDILAPTGGRLLTTIDNLVSTINERMRLEKDMQALTAQARTSSKILSALPFVIMGGMWLMNPSYYGEMLSTFSGKLTFLLCIVWMSFGIYVNKMIMKIDY